MRERFEMPGRLDMTDEEKRILLARLVRATRWVLVILHIMLYSNFRVSVIWFYLKSTVLLRIKSCGGGDVVHLIKLI